jgi:hypothetical protein
MILPGQEAGCQKSPRALGAIGQLAGQRADGTTSDAAACAVQFDDYVSPILQSRERPDALQARRLKADHAVSLRLNHRAQERVLVSEVLIELGLACPACFQNLVQTRFRRAIDGDESNCSLDDARPCGDTRAVRPR